jgi:hypothetical protein
MQALGVFMLDYILGGTIMTGWKIVISYYDGLWRPALCKLEIPKDADVVGQDPRVSFNPGSLFMENIETGETIQLSDDYTIQQPTPVTEPVKCRCSKAKVIGLYKCKSAPFESAKPDKLVPLHGEGFSTYEIANEWNGIANLFLPKDVAATEMASFLFDSNNARHPTKYAPGNIITPHDFDPSPDNECAPGIHFFRDCIEAIRYAADPDVTRSSYPLRVCRMLNEIKVVPPESTS